MANALAPELSSCQQRRGTVDGTVKLKLEKKQQILASAVALVPIKDHLQNLAFYKRTIYDEKQSRYRTIEGVVPGEYMLYA